jgi:transcription-repair coupling factor (superfamily II helicase)
MIENSSLPRAGEANADAAADPSLTPLSPGNIAAAAWQIHDVRGDGALLYLADDDRQAEAIARALCILAPARPVIFVPSSDALPGQEAPASPANIGQRVAALHCLRKAVADHQTGIICVASGEAAAQRYPSPESFDIVPPTLEVGDKLVASEFAAMVEALGYIEDDRVDEPGEVAVRGQVIDLFPVDAGAPVRIELSDGQVAAIRSFDPVTQRTADELTALAIGRASEPVVGEGVSILEHLPAGSIMAAPKAETRRRRFRSLAEDAAARSGGALDAINEERWQAELAAWCNAAVDTEAYFDMPRFAEARSPLAALAKFVEPRLGTASFLLVGSERDLRFLRPRIAKRIGLSCVEVNELAELGALPPDCFGSLPLNADRGFLRAGLMVVAAADIIGSRAVSADGEDFRPGAAVLVHGDVRVGDVVIHEDHGVARVEGLEDAPGGAGGEMIALAFSGGARRLVAAGDAALLWRYGADADAVTLDKLDGSSWQKRRAEVSAAIEDIATGLALLAREREQIAAPVFEPDHAAYERFVSGFPFNETADQSRAFAAVRADLASGRPMDRLVIGDVGYGKTEVALRAAALAALSGYQVIVAAPTTVLVRQHLSLFAERFAASGISVAGLSRLSSAAEKKAVKAGLADGSIGIVIGTGAVMGKSVVYRRPGLVIIDEEQKFGAADKARLRGDASMHQLSLSATPIPRSLQLAMVGLRQLSIIATPPARRQPVRTSLDIFDPGRVRTLLMREHGRRGQSFVVVPRIEDMPILLERLQRAAPELRIVEAHGKLPAKDADAVMVDFAAGRGDVLLATNIIEAGLDIPRANTMIVWRADRFGLAQLHQLRGRVGRGARRGQMLLLTEEGAKIAEPTWKRLRTLAALDQLGAGFEISASDLDARGSGDILGEAQAGHVHLVGADLYQHLLAAALRRSRGERVDDWVAELRIGSEGRLPADWIPDVDLRLSLYLRLARMALEADIDAFEEELADRFGPLPADAQMLLMHARLRGMAQHARIARIDAGKAAIALTLRPDFEGDLAAEGFRQKDGRWIRAGEFPDAGRAEQLLLILETLTVPARAQSARSPKSAKA